MFHYMYQMKRLDDLTIEKITSLTKSGLSLNNITKITGLSKSIVYYWFRKVSKNKMPKVSINQSLQEEIGEFIGAFCGDGNYFLDKNYQYKIRIYLGLHEEWYANHLNEHTKKIFSKYGKVWCDRKRKICIFRIMGVDVISFIKDKVSWEGRKAYSIRLKNNRKMYTKDFKIGFLRGLYMTDGWLNKETGNVGFGCTSKNLVDDFSNILSEFSIEHHRYSFDKEGRKTLFYLRIPRRYSKEFLREIKIKKMLPTGISGKAF